MQAGYKPAAPSVDPHKQLVEPVAIGRRMDHPGRRSIRAPEVPLQCVLPRSGKVSYPEIEGMKAPELIRWIDDLHNDTIDEMNVERIARKDVTARC